MLSTALKGVQYTQKNLHSSAPGEKKNFGAMWAAATVSTSNRQTPPRFREHRPPTHRNARALLREMITPSTRDHVL